MGDRLKGKVAVITGGASGMGRATVEKFVTDMGEPCRRTIDAMLTGPILGMKHAAPVMREQRSGAIISTASVAGLKADYAEAVKPRLQKMQPIPRSGEPADIANAVCFLASDEASFISGHALVVDGALTAGAWPNPEFGPGLIESLQQVLGIDKDEGLDMLYHAR